MIGIRCSYANGQTLDALGELIEARRRVLGEATEDAVIAVGIDALNSLRAATRSAEKAKKFKTTIEATGWYGGFSKTTNKPCFRQAPLPMAARVDVGNARVKWLTKGVRDMKRRRVFKVTPEHESVRPYYVVAESAKIAQEFEKRAASHRVAQYGALAKNALGVAMAKISTRNTPLKGGAESRAKASKLAQVVRGDGYLTISDKIDFSVAALRGGRNTVNLSLQKAANKVAGYLARNCVRRGLRETIATPFPEVRGRKAK